MKPHRIIRLAICLAVTVLFLSYSLGAEAPGHALVKRLENIAYDLRLNWNMPKDKDDRIVIVDIDEKSLNQIGQWPWPRNILAKIVDTLFEQYHIKVAGFDIVFAEPDNSSGLNVLERLARRQMKDIPEFKQVLTQIRPQLENDHIFADSLANRNVVLGFVFSQNPGISKGLLPISGSTQGSNWHHKLHQKLPLFYPQGYLANLPILQNSAIHGGFFDNPSVDADGIFRRVPLIQIHENNSYQSLSLAVASAALGYPDVSIVVTSMGLYNAIEHIELGERHIRVDERINALIPYRGKQYSFPYVSAVDVLQKKTEPVILKDKIILFGSSAAGLKDLRATPVQKVYSGVEVHANLVAGILDETFKHEPLYIKASELAGLLIIGLIMAIVIPLLSPLRSLIVSTTLIAAIILMSILAWEAHIVLPIMNYLLLITGLFFFQMSYGFFIESRDKRALSKVFGQYIPPELVEELNIDAQSLSLEGESREMTVLFSDVRSFTTISENLDPKALSELMNEFLTPMTRIIHKHRGTIDKYMGDAIMAFWGAPLEDPYHQKNALLAAMEMIDTLNTLQPKFQERGWPEIKIGVGLNSGVMNVGNMGSEFRMAYTVLGDAVNLGSRLEGLTKQYGVDIIISESTQKAVPEFEYIELDRVRVKGKDKPVTIYEPLGFSIELEKNLRLEAKRFKKALQLYRERNWDSAEREIFSLTQSNPDKTVYRIYLDRIAKLRNAPPDENWDGVFDHKTK